MLEVCSGGHYNDLATRRVLLEALTNVKSKFGEEELLRFFRQVSSTNLTVVAPPSPEAMRRIAPLTDEKDVHVLAGALSSGADCLVSLDRRHIITERVLSANLPFQVLLPGDFLKKVLGDVSEEG